MLSSSSVFSSSNENTLEAPSMSYIFKPPNYNAIESPNIAVFIKNLTKKDLTTKDKALSSLLTEFEKDSNQFDLNILDAWVILYPRLAIESSRSVRQKSHKLQGLLFKKFGKSAAPYMPLVIGPFLLALFDPDKLVSRSASLSIENIFPEKAKQAKLWTVFEKNILDCISNIILKESPSTLSDSRHTTKEESQAKYNRVVATAILAFSFLIRNLKHDQTYQDDYYLILQDKSLWKLIYKSDTFVATSTIQLLSTVLEKKPSKLDTFISDVAKIVYSKALSSSTAKLIPIEFVNLFINISKYYPDFWKLSSDPNSSNFNKVLKFFSNSSPDSLPEFWLTVQKFLNVVPEDCFSYSFATPEQASHLLLTISDSIPKVSPKFLLQIWAVYFDVVSKLLADLIDKSTRQMIIEKHVCPLFDEVIINENSEYKKDKSDDIYIYFGHGLTNIWEDSPSDAEIIYQHLNSLVSTRLTYLDEKESFHISHAWTIIIKKIRTQSSAFEEGLFTIVLEAINSLVRTKGKWTFPIEIIQGVISEFYSIIVLNIRDKFVEFFYNNFANFFVAGDHVALLNLFSTYVQKTSNTSIPQAVFSDTLSFFSGSSISQNSDTLIQILKASQTLKEKLYLVPTLESVLKHKIEDEIIRKYSDDKISWEIVKLSCLASDILVSPVWIDNVIAEITDIYLTSEEYRPVFLETFYSIFKSSPMILRRFIKTKRGQNFTSKVWHWAETDSFEIQAKKITNLLRDQARPEDIAQGNKDIFLALARTLLEDVISSDECPLDLLVNRALSLYPHARNNREMLDALVFPESIWYERFDLYFKYKINEETVISTRFGSTFYLVKGQYGNGHIGLEKLLRMAAFTIGFLQKSKILSKLTEEEQKCLIINTQYAVEVAIDIRNKGLENLPSVFNNLTNEETLLNLQNDGINLLYSILEGSKFSDIENAAKCNKVNRNVITQLLKNSKELSTKGIYSARILANIFDRITLKTKPSQSSLNDYFNIVYKNYKQNIDFCSFASIYGFPGKIHKVPAVKTWINDLVGDALGLKSDLNLEESLIKLSLLDGLLLNFGPKLAKYPPLMPQKSLMLVKSLFDLFEGEIKYSLKFCNIRYTVCSIYFHMLPLNKDFNSDIWSYIVSFLVDSLSICSTNFENSIVYPVTHISLQLYSNLKELAYENNTLTLILEENKANLEEEIIEVLYSCKKTDENSTAIMKVYKSLFDATSSIPISNFEIENIYDLLNTKSRHIQNIAFEVLHKYIPSQSEDLSIQAALATDDEQIKVEISYDLLKKVTKAPRQPGEDYVYTSELRSYLLTWILIFDHFTNSTLKLKAAYLHALSEGGYFNQLIDMLLHILRIGYQHTVDGSNYDLDNYSVLEESVHSSQYNLIWVSNIVYYLLMLNCPSWCKNWWREIKNRSQSSAVEAYTRKHISGRIIAKEISNVTTSLSQKKSTTDNVSMKVKVSKIVSEVYAYYSIEGEVMELVVKFPNEFPLKDISFTGPKRLGVKKEKWRAWLLASQAVITTQNGSVLDSLYLFEKNVSLHFAGISECAICYSIIHQDSSLPNKKCPTCKHKFHSGCLYKWFKTAGNSACPLCRSNFIPSSTDRYNST